MSNDAGWVSVDEAMPPSGLPVLAAFRNSYGKARVVRAEYAAAKTLYASEETMAEFGEYDEESDEYWAPEGWYETNENEETHWAISDRVTHWMRLPLHPDSVANGSTQTEATEATHG